jgi:peptidoglycan hydrolase-like protein with peptidoglycan-binding domain
MNKGVAMVGLTVVVFLLSGCVSRAYYYGKLDLPSKPKDAPVDVLLPGEVLSRPYKVIGVVQIDGYYGTGTETLIRGAQAKARKSGGDAIVLGPVGQRVVQYNMYIPGEAGYAGAGAVSTPAGTAAVAVIKAPTPTQIIPCQVAWPTMSAIVLAYEQQAAQPTPK